MPTLTGGMTLAGTGMVFSPPPPPPEFSSFSFKTADDILRPSDVAKTYLYPNSKRGGIRTFKISETKFVTIGMYKTTNSGTDPSDVTYYCTLSTIANDGTITQINAVELWNIQNYGTWGQESDCGYCEIYQFDTDKYAIAEYYGNCNGGGSQNYNSYLRPFTLDTTTGAVTKANNWTTLPKSDMSWSSTPQYADRIGGGCVIDSTKMWRMRTTGGTDKVFTALLRYRTYHWIHTIDWANFNISHSVNTVYNEESGQPLMSNDRLTKFLMPGGDKIMTMSMTGGGNNIGCLVIDVSGATPVPGPRRDYRFQAYGGTMMDGININGDGVGMTSTMGTVFCENTAGNIAAISFTITGTNDNTNINTSLNFGSEASNFTQAFRLDDSRAAVVMKNGNGSGQTWTVATLSSDGTMTSIGPPTSNTNVDSYNGMNAVKLDSGKILSVTRAAISTDGSDGYLVE